MGSRSTSFTMGFLAATATATALASTPAPLAVDQQVRGEITSADAINWRDGSRSELFTITLDEGQGVRFDVTGPLPAQLTLFRDGELLQASGDTGDEASLALRAPRHGRYVLAVSGRDASAFGPFVLAATRMQVYGGEALEAGAAITDWAPSPRTIPLRIAEDGIYRIRMASDDFDTVLSLEGNGISLRSDDAEGSNSMLTVPLAAGTYSLLASGYQEEMGGQYELSVANHTLPAGVEPAEDGELVPGRDISALYQGQPLRYSLRVDRRSLLRLDMRSSEIDSALRLEGNGVPLEDDDSGEMLDARITTVLQPGEYTVHASAFDGGAGVFTISAELSDVPADAGGGPLQVGQARTVRLMSGASDRYSFNIARAGTYLIEMSSEDGVDSLLRLFGAAGEVAMDDDSGGGLDARIEEHLQAGEYTLEASSATGGESGRYRIGVRRR